MFRITEQAKNELNGLLSSCKDESVVTFYWADKQFDNKRGANGENIIFQTGVEGWRLGTMPVSRQHHV